MRTRSRRLRPSHLARLAALTAAFAFPLAAAAQDGPALGGFWRSFFARPAGPPPAPADNPSTPAKIALGKLLFESTDLSADGTRSCRSCHEPERAFSDGRPRALARDGGELERNAPMLMNLAWAPSLMWDGRADSLEHQAAMPIENPRELAGAWPDIVRRIKLKPEVDVAFHVAFSERPAAQPVTVTRALAAYVRSLVSPPSRFDRWVAGDDAALSQTELSGFAVFVGKAGCVACHAGWRFTDDKFHDIGLPHDTTRPDPGHGAIAGGVPGLAAFKTPSLRELPRTAPYMHDGSKPTLAAVVDHYAGTAAGPGTAATHAGLVARPSLDSSVVRGLVLGADEKAALIAFLGAISAAP